MSNKIEKTETKTEKAAVPKPPRMGEVIHVKAAAGRKVMNNDASSWFSEKEAVPVNVNVRILRLLQDKDLIRTK